LENLEKLEILQDNTPLFTTFSFLTPSFFTSKTLSDFTIDVLAKFDMASFALPEDLAWKLGHPLGDSYEYPVEPLAAVQVSMQDTTCASFATDSFLVFTPDPPLFPVFLIEKLQMFRGFSKYLPFPYFFYLSSLSCHFSQVN
jgi:hypothetical protein